MSKSRVKLNPETWSRLVKYLHPTKPTGSADKQQSPSTDSDDKQLSLTKKTRKKHVHIPDCVGYSGAIKPEERIALIQGVLEWECEFTYYLCPKDQAALDSWLNENTDFYNSYKDKIILISKWRESEQWQNAAKIYDAYRAGDRKDAITLSIATDVVAFWDRHKEVPEHQITDHILQEVKDCLSWMTPQDSTNDSVNVLMYKHDVTKAMFDVFQNYKKLGYKEPLIHCQFKFEYPKAEKAASSSKRIMEATAPRPKTDPIPTSSPSNLMDSVFDRALVVLTRRGSAERTDIDSDKAVELLFKMYHMEKRTSASSSPEDKEIISRFAHEQAGEYPGVVAHSIQLEKDSEVVAVGMLTDEDPSKVKTLISSDAMAAFKRDSLMPSPRRTSESFAPAPSAESPQSDQGEKKAVRY